MAADPGVLVLDQGTTSTRATVVGADGTPSPFVRRRLPQSYPAPGRVEHDPERIWADARAVLTEALGAHGGPEGPAAIGITNQRETTVVWERSTGRPVHPAIVWQDRRTADRCERLREEGAGEIVGARTGLVLDPYFSATKVAWILDRVEGARSAAERGELAFGTIDSWLLWKLTGGAVHATDATNASRTSLFDIHEQRWDPELLELFDVPPDLLLPDVRDTAGDFGVTDEEAVGFALPVAAMVGDQQAAAFGQAAHEPGTVKATYGTGAFLLENVGPDPIRSEHRLLTTVAWRLDGDTTYALEGSIFSAGSAIQWLHEEMGLLEDPAESAAVADAIDDTGGVYLVPAFTGLGAPHWNADARGAVVGLGRDSGRRQVVRAALESIAYQTRDLIEAMAADGARVPTALRVDGGLSANDWAMGFLADVLDVPVQRPVVTETTALGAGFLAGLAAGVFADLEDVAARWREDRRWRPDMEPERRERLYRGWREAVARVITPPPPPTPPGGADGRGSR